MASILKAGSDVLNVVTGLATSLGEGTGALNDFVTQQRHNQQIRYTQQRVDYKREVQLAGARRMTELEEEVLKFRKGNTKREELFAAAMARSEAAFAAADKAAVTE